MNVKVFFGVIASGVLLAAGASASLVQFPGSPGFSPVAGWADGTFSSDVSGINFNGAVDGFAVSELHGEYAAWNAFGQSGEQIFFNSPVVLHSLDLGECTYCVYTPSSYTVSLYGASDNLIASQTITPSVTPQLLTFQKTEVESVEFTFAGGVNNRNFTGATNSGWYEVSNINYDVLTGPGVPEPKTWALLLIGLGGVGAHLRARRGAALAA